MVLPLAKLQDASKLVLAASIKVLQLTMLSLGNVVQLGLLLQGKSVAMIVEDTTLATLDLLNLQAVLHHGLRIVKEPTIAAETTMAVKIKMVATTELRLETQPLGNNKVKLLLMVLLPHTPAVILLQAMVLAIQLNKQWVLHLVLLLD